MDLMLQKIYKDLMEVKKEKGAVPEADVTHAVAEIRKHFRNLAPNAIVAATDEFVAARLLPASVFYRLGLELEQLYRKKWRVSLDRLVTLERMLKSCKVSASAVVALVQGCDSPEPPGLSSRDFERRSWHLAKILPKLLSSGLITSGRPEFRHLSHLHRSMAAALHSLNTWRSRNPAASAHDLAARVFAAAGQCLSALASCPCLTSKVLQVARDYELVPLADASVRITDSLAKYLDFDLAKIDLRGLVTRLGLLIDEYFAEASAAGILE